MTDVFLAGNTALCWARLILPPPPNARARQYHYKCPRGMSNLLSLCPVHRSAGSHGLKVSNSIDSAFIKVVYMGECFMACMYYTVVCNTNIGV